MGTLLLQIILVIAIYLAASSRAQSSAQSCQAGSILRTDENAVDVGSTRVFLNTDDPAECDGQVYGWHMCRARDSNVQNPEVILAVYRSIVVGTFTRVSGSYKDLSVSEDDFEYNEEYELECLDYILGPSEFFRVKRGDMVGVCYEDGSNRLELVVEHSEKELEILSTGQSCSIVARISDQFPREEVALLLSVYIDINECLLEEGLCHENATCSDVVGGEDSYICTCNPGFSGDGLSCVGDMEGATEVMSTGSEVSGGGGSEGGTGMVINETPTASNKEENVSSTPRDNRERTQQGNGSIVGAIVAAFIVGFLIIAVVVASIVLYVSRRRIERALGRTIDLRRISTRKKIATLAKVPDEGHDYDYVTTTGHPGDNEYDTVNRTPLPALTSRAQTSSVVPATDHEVPVQSFPHKNGFDQQLKHSSPAQYYEATLSSTSVKLEVGKDTTSGNGSAYASLIQRTVEEHVYEALSPYQVPASKQESLYAQLSSYKIRNISRENLTFISKLGTGQFGKVNKAVWTDGKEKVEVAVKTLTDSGNTVKFLQEAAIMVQFKHPNILTLHGVVSAGDPKIIVVELMHNGELKSVVTGMRPTSKHPLAQNTPLKLLDFSKQVALGLHYLSARGFVHRDLAARNILVSQNYICKISDFGLSRDLAIVEDDIYVSRGGKIPLKWCAPEAIFHRKYSTASDVWSYGCVLYEIWSLGHKPFETHQTKQVMQVIKKGYRLPPPPGCPKMIYKLMIDTWHPKSSSRPHSKDIVKTLLENVDEVLAIPPEDVPADSQAAVLGAPLDKATHLYQDLQNTYTV